jgi:hypothetical protein
MKSPGGGAKFSGMKNRPTKFSYRPSPKPQYGGGGGQNAGCAAQALMVLLSLAWLLISLV